jgi:hypothetical protein
MKHPAFVSLGLLVSLVACSEAVYPPRPPATPGPPVSDPPHSRATMHLTLSQQGLTQLLDATVPQAGEGTFTLLGQRRYTWRRSPFELRFDGAQGKIGVRGEITGKAEIPGTAVTFTIAALIEAQPVLSADYQAMLQAPTVTLTTEDRVLRAAEWGAGVISGLREMIEKELRATKVDLRPMIAATYQKLAQPVRFQVGDAQACATLGLVGIEAGPTVLAGGVEKDLAAVIAPSVTLPCTAAAPGPGPGAVIPPLQNVVSVQPGPFELVVPVAAAYDELQKAMTQAFTNGKLFFSKEYPDLYLEKPEVYAAGGQIVVKLHLDGFVRKGFKVNLSGDLYLAGHPQVRDNELEVPDMQPTIETQNALLKLKTKLSGEDLRREVRQALRLDISQRLQAVKARLSSELSYYQPPTPVTRPAPAPGAAPMPPERPRTMPSACVRAELGRVEVTGVYPHENYLRVYVKASARTAAYLPCPFPPPAPGR